MSKDVQGRSGAEGTGRGRVDSTGGGGAEGGSGKAQD